MTPTETDQLPVAQSETPSALTPYDASPQEFKSALMRRGENRASLMAWIREALVEGVDFGRIQTKRGMSKPSLWKPGAEKICGMLGLRAVFPTFRDYEQATLTGVEINNVLLRCHLTDAGGTIVSDGVGARSVASCDGDLNKALKMAAKSAMIDATLRCSGLSEVFSQDLDDDERPQAAAPERQTQQAAAGADGKLVTEGQVRLLRVKLKEADLSDVIFKQHYGLDHLADLPFAKMNEALSWIQSMSRPGGGS